MAGNNLSPRQKMINLMYLVFIAMLALNMSKEVLSAFGLMNEKLEVSNDKTTASNAAFFEGLGVKAKEQPEKYQQLFQDAGKVSQMSNEYYNYLDGLKIAMTEKIEDKQDYEIMDKADYLDQLFFSGDGYTSEGKEFIQKLENYRQGTSQVLASIDDSLMNAASKNDLVGAINARFTTGDDNRKVKNRDGVSVDWLDYHYKGFPLIASLTKITQMQADIKSTEEDILSAMLEGQLKSDVSLSNYATILQQPKSAYYQGEKFDGAIVLGRTDNSTKPDAVNLSLDGRKLVEGRDFEMEGGQVRLKVNAGNAGDHKIEGTLTYSQDGEPIEVAVEQTFAVITKPNAAVISADKMNVVYRGVANPITISIPGVPDNKVTASAPGLKKSSGSKYIMNPGKGRTVTINASGTLPDGQRITTPSEFRIKDIPRPSGTIRGEFGGDVKMTRKNLEISTVGAILEDFDFDLNLAISGFKFKVPGQPTIEVRGNKLDGRAKSALKRAKRGDAVQLFDIEAFITNNRSYKLKKVSPVVIEITN